METSLPRKSAGNGRRCHLLRKTRSSPVHQIHENTRGKNPTSESIWSLFDEADDQFELGFGGCVKWTGRLVFESVNSSSIFTDV
jgi:hypothetical protein